MASRELTGVALTIRDTYRLIDCLIDGDRHVAGSRYPAGLPELLNNKSADRALLVERTAQQLAYGLNTVKTLEELHQILSIPRELDAASAFLHEVSVEVAGILEDVDPKKLPTGPDTTAYKSAKKEAR